MPSPRPAQIIGFVVAEVSVHTEHIGNQPLSITDINKFLGWGVIA